MDRVVVGTVDSLLTRVGTYEMLLSVLHHLLSVFSQQLSHIPFTNNAAIPCTPIVLLLV